MAFINERFPEDISYGSTGGPTWNTDVLILKSGFESRNANWGQMRYKFNAAMGVRSNSQLEDLIAWFNAAQGRTHGFRFKDWTDYSSAAFGNAITDTDQNIGIGDGVETEFQLIKTYTQGSQSRVRPITMPVANTTIVALDNVSQPNGWTVDVTTGIITFNSPPGNNVVVSAGFEFDIPVRFDTDQLSISIDHYLTGTLSVPIIEIRI